MSNFYHSPSRNLPKLYMSPDTASSNYNSRPNSNRAGPQYPLFPSTQNHNTLIPSLHMEERKRDQPPLRYAPPDVRKGPEYPNQYRGNLGHNPGQIVNSANFGSYGSSPKGRDLSPFARLVRVHDVPPQGYVERDNSWSKLIRRPEENRMEQYHKVENWKKELDVQMREQKIKKMKQEEEIKNQKVKDELRYQKQIEEMNLKNMKDNELRRLREQSSKKLNKNGQPHNSKNNGHQGMMRRKGSLGNYKNEISIDYEDERPRQRINAFIDNLKAEIIHGQKVFMKDIREAQSMNKKQDRFRNLAERNGLGAQNGGVVRGGLYLQSDQTPAEISFTKSVDNNRQRQQYAERNFQRMESPHFAGGADQDKDDADDFFTGLTNFERATDQAKAKKAKGMTKQVSIKNTEPDLPRADVEIAQAKPSTENNIKKVNKTPTPKPEIMTPAAKKDLPSPKENKIKPVQSNKEFQIVKETQVKVNDQIVKKETSVVAIKPIEKIPTNSKLPQIKVSPDIITQKLTEKPIIPEAKQDKEKQEKQERLNKQEISSQSQPKEIQKPVPVEPKVLVEESKNEVQGLPSIELNADNEPVKTAAVENSNETKDGLMESKSQGEIGNPQAMQDFLKQTGRDKNGMMSERTDVPSLLSLKNQQLKREETPLDQRKIKNFNIWKDSRRGSVETVNLEMFENMLAKEVLRGNGPTFKSPRENTEIAFDGFGYGGKKSERVKNKRSQKSVVIKSSVTAKAIVQAMDKEDLQFNFYEKKVDPIAKLDYMIDHLFG